MDNPESDQWVLYGGCRTKTLALTERRCEQCDLYMQIEDRTVGGAITLYKCPLGHMLFVGAHGQVIK